MSANIPIGKLKFSVFGRGYDDVRGNSGTGASAPDTLNFYPAQAAFDSTGQYCWILISNGGLHKFSTTTWQMVDQGEVPTNALGFYHPSNVDNNIGFSYYGGVAYVFNLTTNEIISTGEISGFAYNGSLMDCILIDDDKLRLASNGQTRATNGIFTIDLNDFSWSVTTHYNSGFSGFIDNDSVYAYYEPEWFYQTGRIFSANASGGEDWSRGASQAGGSAFDKITLQGATAKGYVYIPSYVNGKWTLGKYSGLSGFDYETPSPIKTFGEFPSKPTMYSTTNRGTWYATYTNGRTKACFGSTYGLYVTDFNDMWLIAEGNYQPLAICDGMILAYTYGDFNHTKVFYY